MPSATVTVLVARVEVGKLVQQQSKAVMSGQVRAGGRRADQSWKGRGGEEGRWMPVKPISTHL